MTFDPENIEQSFNGRQAAAFIGVSGNTLARLRRLGVIPAFQIPSRGRGSKFAWRYRCLDLHEFVKANSSYTRFAHPRFQHEFPWTRSRSSSEFPLRMFASRNGAVV